MYVCTYTYEQIKVSSAVQTACSTIGPCAVTSACTAPRSCGGGCAAGVLDQRRRSEPSGFISPYLFMYICTYVYTYNTITLPELRGQGFFWLPRQRSRRRNSFAYFIVRHLLRLQMPRPLLMRCSGPGARGPLGWGRGPGAQGSAPGAQGQVP